MVSIGSNTKLKVAATMAGCAVAGAVAGIAAAGASPSTHAAKTAGTGSARGTWPGPAGPGGPGARFRPPIAGIGPAVHETAVVLNKAGTGFITATEDSGTVQSVSGDKLTIKEAVGKVTYKSVALTIPSNATIYRNFSKASLSALRAGDRVRVVQSSEGTSVMAIDLSQAKWRDPGRFFPGRHNRSLLPGTHNRYLPPGAIPAQPPGAPAAPGGSPAAGA